MILEERISQLEEAQELINESMMLIREAVEGTRQEDQARVYTLGHLNNWANGSNPYDLSIPKIIEKLYEEEREEDY